MDVIQIIPFNPGDVSSQHWTNFSGGSNTAVSAAIVTTPWNVSGVFKNLRLKLANPITGVGTVTGTLYVNGVASLLTVTASLSNKSDATDTTNSISVVAGDTIYMQWDVVAGGLGSQAHACIEFEPTTTGERGYIIGGGATGNNSTVEYMAVFQNDGGGWNNTATMTGSIVGAAGTLNGYRALLSAAPGAGKSRTFVLVKNNVVQDGSGGTVNTTLALSGASATSGTATFSLSLAEGDIIYMRCTPVGPPNSASRIIGLSYTPTNTDEIPYSSASSTFAVTLGVTYFGTVIEANAYGTTEDANQIMISVTPFKAKRFRIEAAAAVTATITLRKNSAATAGDPTISLAAATTGSDLANSLNFGGKCSKFDTSYLQASGSIPASTRMAWVMTPGDVQQDCPVPLPAADYPCLVGNPVVWGATKDINGAVFQFSKRPLRDPAAYYGGYKSPSLLQLGPIRREASDFLTGSWQAQTAWAKIADMGRVFRNFAAQPSLIAQEAWFYLLSENTRLLQGNPTLLFHGPIYNDPFSEDFTYTLNVNDYVGSNYNLFKDDKMIPQRTIGTDDFPTRPNETEGLGVPIIGGVITDEAGDQVGLIKGIYVGLKTVSAVSYAVILVAGHACASGIINARDKNGTSLVWGTDAYAPGKTSWTTIQPGGELYYDINGNRYTLIFITASSATGIGVIAGDPIYINTNGMEPNGDGTGTVIENLFELRKYLMKQWYTQSYKSGAWLPGLTFEFYPGLGAGYDVIDDVSFATAQTQSIVYAGGSGFKGAFVIGAGGRRQSIRDRLADDNVSSCTWMGLNAKNQIFVYLLDRTNATFLGSNRTLKDRRDILSNPKFKIEPKIDWFCNDLGYQYAANYRDDGRGDWNSFNIVGNAPSVVKYGTFTGRRTYGLVRDATTADTVASLQMIIGGPDPPRIVTWSQSLCGMGQDILTGWPITHYQGRGSGGWVDNPVLILSQEFNPADCRTTFTGLDGTGILLGVD